MMEKDKAAKPGVMDRQKDLLEERYDLTPKPDAKVKMTRGKPIPVGPTAKLPEGMTWDQLAAMSPDEIRDKGLFPKGFLPLPHPQPRGRRAWSSRKQQIKQFARLERFDLDFDLPEHFLPEFPPAIFLTTRPDLGDVSQGKLVTVENFQEIFRGILNAQGPGRAAPAGHAVPAAAVQRHRRPQDGASPTGCRASPASTATSTATRRRRPTWSATSARRRTAGGSTRRACGASTSSGCSARSGR